LSIPVRFDWYDQDGRLLAANRGFFTINYTDDSGNLNTLSKRIQECPISQHQKFVHPDVRYIVPHDAPDYMFDLKDPAAILPNRFKTHT
jgi:hypothetical protein